MTAAVHARPAPGARARGSSGLPSPLRLVIACAVALSVTAAAWRTGDWWDLTAPTSDVANLTAARALIFLVVFATVLAAPAVIRSAGRAPLAVFGAWAVYLGLWMTALWPGLQMTDTLDVLTNSRQGIVYEWFSYVYSLLAIAAFDVVPHVASLGVLQIVLTAALMAYASGLLLRRGSGPLPVVVLNLVAAVSAPVIVNSLLVTRDTLFGVLHVFLALYVADAVASRRAIAGGGLVGVALLVGFLSALRGDGMALVLCVPLVLLALRPAPRQLLTGAAVLAGSLVLFHAALPALLRIDPKIPNAYALSLRLNPLGAVLDTDFYSPHKARDLATLGRVIDVEAVRRLATPVEIPAYWEGRWNHQATEEDFAAFTQVADRLMRDNLAIVLGNRVQTFGAATGLAPGGFMGTEMGTAEDPRDRIGAGHRGMTGAPPSEGLYRTLAGALREAARYGGLFSYRAALQFNFLPALLLLAAVLPFWRRLRFEAVFAAIILCRVPLVFAAAPAAQFKYYYSVLLGGFVLAALLLARLRPDHLRRLVPARLQHRPAAS